MRFITLEYEVQSHTLSHKKNSAVIQNLPIPPIGSLEIAAELTKLTQTLYFNGSRTNFVCFLDFVLWHQALEHASYPVTRPAYQER